MGCYIYFCITQTLILTTRKAPLGPFLLPFYFLYICVYFNTMKKYLQFISAADNAAAYPADNLIAMTVAANATLILKFSPGSLGLGQAASLDLVTLTITEDMEKSVMKAIADEIALGPTPTIVV